MSHLIELLQDKDDKKAYVLSKEIGAKSAISDEYYSYFDDFVGLMFAKSSYVRTRGFTLCCAQARWDEVGKLKNALPNMLTLLHDEKPTVVRQCLSALHEVALYRPELCEDIRKEVETIDLSKDKDSLSPLIQKDMIKIINVISGFIVQKKFVAEHTIMNKVTGLLLFLLPLTISIIDLKYSITVVCVVATCAAIQEGHYIRTGREPDICT